jgi:hypothetical protein
MDAAEEPRRPAALPAPARGPADEAVAAAPPPPASDGGRDPGPAA